MVFTAFRLRFHLQHNPNHSTIHIFNSACIECRTQRKQKKGIIKNGNGWNGIYGFSRMRNEFVLMSFGERTPCAAVIVRLYRISIVMQCRAFAIVLQKWNECLSSTRYRSVNGHSRASFRPIWPATTANPKNFNFFRQPFSFGRCNWRRLFSATSHFRSANESHIDRRKSEKKFRNSDCRDNETRVRQNNEDHFAAN